MEKFYKIRLKNIFVSNGYEFEVYAVLEDGKFYEILTNKGIYLANDKNEFDIITYTENNCKLIGNVIRECQVSDVAKFLKFLTVSQKEEIINKVMLQEQSVMNTLNKLDFYEEYYVKPKKKAYFLKNYS